MYFLKHENIHNTAPALKTQGTFQKRGRKIVKRQVRKFNVRLCLLGMSETTLKVLPTKLPKC